MVTVLGPKDKKPENVTIINTTSSSKTWSRGLSPFLLGPVELEGMEASKLVENAWQFSKVYPEHLDEAGNIKEEYWAWRRKGFNSSWAYRYPLGKGKTPKFTFYDGRRLNYIEARKAVYIPLYIEAVKETPAFFILQEVYRQLGAIALFDYDGYNYHERGLTLEQVVENEQEKMGHAFVLAMLLQDNY